ncbi:T9SS-dependent choice-of-anchor J family protein [Flavobacterium phycosphaerae]|uniref:T9SS-dependent choice-of-anchor J family protein n=1 Tax=Flavobacterium phycosphaerae TaxID=2697515 RepID=UPI00138A5F69|nr:choice-of-anchor J domain-containing protein [Flavobacterium phycosphaerae]
MIIAKVRSGMMKKEESFSCLLEKTFDCLGFIKNNIASIVNLLYLRINSIKTIIYEKITLLAFLFLAVFSKGYAQLSEGFEGATFPPPGWTSFIGENGFGTNANWDLTTDPTYVSSGSQAAYVSYESGSGGVNEDWLVTPQFTVTAPNVLLAFYESQNYSFNYGTEYTIRVSTTSATDISSFVTIDTKTEDDLPVDLMTQRAVDLSAYLGQTIYVAFVMSQDDGDDWAIDDVSLQADVDAPNCATMTFPADEATGIAVGPEVTLTWDAPTTGDAPASYDVLFGDTLPLTSIDNFYGNYTTTSANIVLTAYDTTSYWAVIPKNLAGEAIGCSTFSFTTQSPSGSACTSAPYGQYPLDVVYTPQVCDGATEENLTEFADGYAGEYSSMNVTNGLTYQFISSVATDYITISSADASIVYASGTTPVSWTASSDTEIRFYTHIDNACGSEQELRNRSIICSGSTATIPDCAVMTYPADGANDIPLNQAVTFTWEPAPTGDAPVSYDLYGGAALPLTSADFVANYTTTSADFIFDTYNTTIYWMIVAKNLAGEAVGCTPFTFTTVMSPGYCLDAPSGEYPFGDIFTNDICDGATAQEIVPDGYAGEYSSVAVTAGYTYEFSSSIATDFITISDVDGTVSLVSGITPVTYTATADEVVRFYTHADDQCAANTDFRSRLVMCSGATISAPDCATMTFPADEAIDVPVNTPVTFTWDAPTTGDAPDSYDVYGGIALPLTAADFIANFTTTSADFTLTTFNTTFYWMVVPKNLGGEATGCATFSFTTMASPGYCLDAFVDPWPTDTYTVNSCDGTTVEDITPDGDGYSGEYSNVNVTAGFTYEFSSSIATDWITLSTDDGATAAAYGASPLTWTATADGVVRFYTHTDDQCGTDNLERYRSIVCQGDLATPTFGTTNFKVYPNPVKDVLNLSSEKNITKVQVTNLLGQVILTKSLNATQGQIDVANLASGTYMVKVTSDDLVKTIKVIKE